VASQLAFTVCVALLCAGCFTGSAASGLPCTEDLDCGLDDRCVDGFCGGPPATTTMTDPTTESSTTDPTTTTTGEGPCADQPGAQCVPLVLGMPDADCDSDCSLPTCGDGTHNPHAPNDAFNPAMGFELCDDGVQGTKLDSPLCDFDCTLVQCDGYFNAMADDDVEPCDDGDSDDFNGCTNACQIPALAERFDQEAWTSEPYDLTNYAGTPWEDTTGVDTSGWVWVDGRWNSGPIPYRERGTTQFTEQYSYAGTTRLVSLPFAIPASVPADFVMQLRFFHEIAIEYASSMGDTCTLDPGRRGDGGIVRLRVGSDDATLLPEGGYDDLIDDCDGIAAGGIQPNPNPLRLDGGVALTGGESGLVIVDLTEYLGAAEVRLVFEFGTDCVHCIEDFYSPSLWTIDDVIVAAFPIE